MAQSEADRIQELESEVARLQKQLDSAPAPAPATVKARKGSRWRSFWSALLIVVACLLAPLSVVAVWAKSEVTDTERYVSTVAPLAADPAIQQAVSDRVTQEVLTYIDIPALTQEAIDAISANRDLKPRQTAALDSLGGALDSGIEGFVGDQVANIVQSDIFDEFWTEANTRAHQRLNQVLSGDTSGPVSIEGNDVTLDVGQVIAQVKQRLLDRGLTIAEKIPVVNSEMVIFQSDNLAAAQRAYSLLNALGLWIPIAAAVLAILGVLIANDRRKAVLGVGIGLAIATVLAAVAVVVIRGEYLNALPPTVNRAAATSFFDILTTYLVQTLWAGLAAAVVIVLGALLTGPSKFGTGVRQLSKAAAGAVQGQLASWGATMTALRRWVAGNAGGLRIGVTVIALVIVLFTRYKTVGLILWTTVALLVALFLIQVFASGSTALDDEVTDDDGDREPEVSAAAS